MVVLSARFAFLASLCAVITVAIPPRVEAAHIYGGHSMEKYALSPHGHRRARSTSSPGRQAETPRHDNDEHNEHHSPDLPPLLGRYRVPDQTQKLHDHADHEVPRSVFARSRYRRASTFYDRRSSVYVPGEHGDTYLVSGASPRNMGNGDSGMRGRSSHAYDRRQVDESDLALGRIDIISGSRLPAGSRRLASLIVDSTPVDWTSGQTTSKAFQLNASTSNQTQFIMMPIDSDVAGSLTKHVTLATEVFDASSAAMVMYCATYDSDPGATSALLMTPCTTQPALVNDAGDPCTGNESDASPSNPHASQMFSYDPSTGKIEPISALSAADDSDDLAACAGAIVRRQNGNGNGNPTTSRPATPSSASTSVAPAATTSSALQQTRNVTLVYVAGALEVPAASPSTRASNAIDPNRDHAPAAVLTTITTTILATSTPPNPRSSTHAVTPARAAVSVSITSTPSTPASASAGPSKSASASAAAPTKASVDAAESFEVDIVGVGPSATTSGVSTTTSHSSASATPNPLAVASSVANQVLSRRDAIVSVSVVR